MLNDAAQIIGDVPGKHLDPQLLVRSQAENSLGFIMISYESKPPLAGTPSSRFYDLLFFRGPEIYECARMNRDLRFQLHADVAFHTFKLFGREDGTRVFLFAASDQVLHRFRSTFYYEPCLKVQIEGLSRKHIATLLQSTGCQKGIIECNEFTHPTPSLHLKDITSSDDIIHYQPAFKRGRILVYDIEKNKELIEERYASLSKRSAQSSSRGQNPVDDKSTDTSRTLIQSIDHSKHLTDDEALTTADEQEAEEFTSFLQQILNSPTPADPSAVSLAEGSTAGGPRPVEDSAHHLHDNNFQSSAFVITSRSEVTQPPTSTRRKPASPPLQRWEKKLSRKSAKTQPEQIIPAIQNKDSTPEPFEYAKLLERLFRSFRQQVFESFGDKSDEVVSEAERKLRILTPEFDLHSLNENTAILVLDLIESIAGGASFMKRPRLRQAALTLVADLYNKQYELLEKHQVIDKVEQFYYRLKR